MGVEHGLQPAQAGGRDEQVVPARHDERAHQPGEHDRDRILHHKTKGQDEGQVVRGTREGPLTVAPFRAWRGSRISVARGPTLVEAPPMIAGRGRFGEPPKSAQGDLVNPAGTPNRPASACRSVRRLPRSVRNANPPGPPLGAGAGVAPRPAGELEEAVERQPVGGRGRAAAAGREGRPAAAAGRRHHASARLGTARRGAHRAGGDRRPGQRGQVLDGLDRGVAVVAAPGRVAHGEADRRVVAGGRARSRSAGARAPGWPRSG